MFIDTSYLVALASANDRHHSTALDYAAEIRKSGIRSVTTEAILFELGSAFSKARYREAAVQTRQALLSDERVRVIAVTSDLVTRAWELFADRPDKDWSATDCLSFVVMADLRVSDALTTDGHFEQAGFRTLLRVT